MEGDAWDRHRASGGNRALLDVFAGVTEVAYLEGAHSRGVQGNAEANMCYHTSTAFDRAVVVAGFVIRYNNVSKRP